jgi:radical SAM protein with 4Fe4S-binding SPASM domain
MPALCTSLGADHVSFNRYLGPPLPEVEPAPGELANAVSRIEALRAEGARVKFGNCVPPCFAPSSSSGCLAGVAYCTVDPWGEVRPCNHSPTRCGSLLQASMEEIWNGPEMRAWRARIPEICHTCAAFPRCHGGCRAQAEVLDRTTDPLMGAPLEQSPEPEIIELGSEWRPVSRCEVRRESFGYVLLRGNHIVPLAADDRPILDACDGRATLTALGKRFGQHGLRLIYELYQRGIVEMQT